MLGQTEVIGEIEGMIQSEVGSFLQLKSQLNEMSRSPVLTISDKANQLLIVQGNLENDLPGAIEKSKSSGVSDLISATGFLASMELQIYNVGSLRGEYTGLGGSAKASLIGGIPDWILYIGGALVLWKIIRRKS